MIVSAEEAASSSWLGVEWASIALVFGVGLVATLVVVGFYALGTRLLAVGAPDIEVPAGEDPDGPTAVVRPRTQARPLPATVGAVLCYAVGVVATGYGIFLVVPFFHGS